MLMKSNKGTATVCNIHTLKDELVKTILVDLFSFPFLIDFMM